MLLLKSRIVTKKDNYNIIYGIYLLFQIELKWLVLLIFLDILFFILLIYFTNQNNIHKIN